MRLILFFNGWGMNEKVVEGIDIPEGYDLKVINFPYEVNLELTKYEKVIAVGYSIFSYYLSISIYSHYLFKFPICSFNKFREIIASKGPTHSDNFFIFS